MYIYIYVCINIYVFNIYLYIYIQEEIFSPVMTLSGHLKVPAAATLHVVGDLHGQFCELMTVISGCVLFFFQQQKRGKQWGIQPKFSVITWGYDGNIADIVVIKGGYIYIYDI